MEPCPHPQAEPWLPPHKERVHTTFREPFVGLCHSLEDPRFPIITEPRLQHTAKPRSQYIEEAEPRLLHHGAKRPALPSLSFGGSSRERSPGPTRLYVTNPGPWRQYLTRMLDHTRCHPRSQRLYRMRGPALLVRGTSSPSTTEPRQPPLTEPHFIIISYAGRTSLTAESCSLLIEYFIPNNILHTVMKSLNSRYLWSPGPRHPTSEHFMINEPRHLLLACGVLRSKASGATTRLNRGAPTTRTCGVPTTPHATPVTLICNGAYPLAHAPLTIARSQNEEPRRVMVVEARIHIE